MKFKNLIFLALCCLFFSSCFELEETYNINEDGSYALNYNVDMGNIIGLISRMSPDSVKATKEYNIGKDTTILVRP